MVHVRDLLRGALTRTAPGALAGFAVLIGSSPSARAHFSLATLGLTFLAAATTAAGSMLALLAMRSRLRSDAAVAGRRAFIVGLAAFAATTTARPFLSFVNPFGEYLLMGVSGVLLGVAMFFPWLESRHAAAAARAIGGDQSLLLAEPEPMRSPVARPVPDRDLTPNGR